MPAQKREWKDIVDRSNGTMSFVPESLTEKATAWQNRRIGFSKKANELAKEEAEIGLMFNDLIHSLRLYFEELKTPEKIWMADIGFNTEALKEGKFIVNITPAERQA